MFSRLRGESGIGLVELLIAMLVMSVAIFALVAGLTSGVESTKRASKTSTAGSLADQRMETYRRVTYATLAANDSPMPTPSTPGADGRMYYVKSSTSPETCIFGGTPTMDVTLTPPALRCAAIVSPPAPKSRPVKIVTVIVYDTDGATELIKQSSTFDESAGS